MGETRTDPGARVPRVVLGVLVLLAVAWVAVAVSTVPGVRDRLGRDPLWDGWFQCSGYVLAALVALLRVTLRRDGRAVWGCVAAALTLRALAFLWSVLVLPLPPSYPSLADAAWLLSGALLGVALALLVRERLPRNSRTLVVDALLGGVTVAALSVTVLYGTLVRLTAPGTPGDVVATNLTYPLLDVVLLTLVGILLVGDRTHLSRPLLVLFVGVVLLATVDGVFLYLVSTGGFRPGTVLTPTSLGGTALIAAAGWVRTSAARRPTEREAGLRVPALLALACVTIMLWSAPRDTPLVGPVLAAVGVGLAILRAYLTLSVDRRDVMAAIDARQRDLERFRAMVEASGDYMAMADPAGRVVYVNPAGRRLVGLAEDHDVTSMVVADFLPRDGHDAWTDVRRPTALGAGLWEGESRLRDFRGGPPIPVATSTFAIRDTDTGEVRLMATVQRDVRARRAAEEQLERFRSLVEASADFIAIAAVDGRVLYVNPAGRAMVGLDPKVDVTTTTIADYVTDEVMVASVEVEQLAVVQHGSWQGESTLRDLRGGPPIPVAINSFLMRHLDTGAPWLLGTVQRDISGRMRAEREMRELAEQRRVLLDHLVEAQEDERNRIAADVHDDSVQALAAVELRLALLHRDVAERPDLRSSLEAVQDTVLGAMRRLRHLLFDLESPAREHDLGSALSEAAAHVLEDQVRWRIEGEGGGGLDVGGRVTAYRVAKEALVNVRKHAAAHHVVVGLHDRDGGVEVSVTDDGRGFDPASVGDRPGHLGIPGVRDRAAVAGGEVSVESAPGRGTTFRVWLPVHPPAVDPGEGEGAGAGSG